MRMLRFSIGILTLSLLFGSCKFLGSTSSKSYVGKEFETESGLKYTIHKAGDGVRAELGNIVQVHYSGTLQDTVEFDNSFIY